MRRVDAAGSQAALSRQVGGTLLGRVFLRTHLGLGDHIICNALVRRLAALGQVILPVKAHNEASVRWMLRDANVFVVGIADDAAADEFIDMMRRSSDALVDVSFVREPRHAQFFSSGVHFDEFFYVLAGLPPRVRHREFALQREPQRELALARRFEPFARGERYIFVHDDTSRGFRLDATLLPPGLPVASPQPGWTDNIFDYISLIEGAVAVHCFDSSFALLIDYLDLAPGRRFLHEYVRSYPQVRNGHLLNPAYRPSGWQFIRDGLASGAVARP